MITKPESQQSVLEILKNLRGLDPLKQLFWSELNYERVNQPLSRRGWTDTASKALADDPILFASGGENGDFGVIYARLAPDSLLLGHERPVVSKLLQDHPYALFVFSDKSQTRWHFLNVKYDEQSAKRRLFRRITVGPEERLRTASERISLLDLSSINPDLFGLSPLTIQKAHDDAFDVEAVTKQFFEEYKAVFRILEDDLKRQTKDSRWAHDYALQFLNRVMFLYFVQRKRWLGDDTDFLLTFWETYKTASSSKDLFFDKWLKILFFDAFNRKFHGGHRHFPDKIRQILSIAPYLNGGLFRENELDQLHTFNITDGRFEQILKFLERYNFTIAEDSPLDQEVAVDPEMIGKVYESLVNVSSEIDERGEAGIFYTPRTEIDLMCRLSLVDNLSNHLGHEHKSLFYELILAFEPDEKAQADKTAASAHLWQKVNEYLQELTILDPACGSGSFLVGMLHVVDDLKKRANQQLGIKQAAFERKKRIIGQSLYGVDVMDWAVHVAELRLWLALIIDSEFTKEELHVIEEPLLPHLTFRVRCGDSLVQEVAGINMGHIRNAHDIPSALKGRIAEIKREKLKFYNNSPDRKFRSVKELENEELRLFREILDYRKQKIQEEINLLNRKIEGPREAQVGLLSGKIEARSHQLDLQATEWQKQVELLKSDLDRIGQAAQAMKTAKDVPFVWDISFVEVFSGEEKGFDIVIGNPPYVRQENISDPKIPREKITSESKRDYKARLARSVYQEFPRFFGYDYKKETVKHKLDAKSDLYIYFYFHGLSLLNSKGSFCFITSNSWLDVGYGADLQEFLMKHCHVKMIIDNQVKRSFASADVNTVIVLFSSPDDTKDVGLDKTAKFIMFKVPFEHILSPVIFEEIENSKERKISKEYRDYPINQKKSLEDGCEVPEEDSDADLKKEKAKKASGFLIKSAKYIGNKWGGKYLRAPDIYWTLLSSDFPLLPLGAKTFWEFGRGRRTGCDEFFYLSQQVLQDWKIEKKYLKPLIKSPTEFISCGPTTSQMAPNLYVFLCHEPKEKLKGTRALEFIKYGESKGFHKRNLLGAGGRWYDLGVQKTADIILPIAFNDRFFVVLNDAAADIHQRFATLILNQQEKKYLEPLMAILNSSLIALMAEVLGRRGLGQGALDFPPEDWRHVLIPDLRAIRREDLIRLEQKWKQLLKRAPLKFSDAINDRFHQDLDSILMKILGFNEKMVSRLYDDITLLINDRLRKAGSL